mgnify:CR=1 FL=1
MAVPAQGEGQPTLRQIVLGEGGFVEQDGVVAQWFARFGAVAALVRPDHYVYGGFADPDAADEPSEVLFAELQEVDLDPQ